MAFPTDALTASTIAASPQRRQVSVLFVDLVGSTELAAAVDPEDLQDFLGQFLGCCANSVEAHGGFVARYMGDGLLAYFGYPDAREDDGVRAVQAALHIRTEAGRLQRPDGTPVAVRSGIATGLVVVGGILGAGSAQERSIAGEAPNLAARLQSAAGPNCVLVCKATRRLASSAFSFRDRGRANLKGFAEPQQIWEVDGPTGADHRGWSRRRTAPLVGRTGELGELQNAWRDAARGQSIVVEIAGEAGIGKSRLLDALRDSLIEPHAWIAVHASAIFADTPYFVADQIAPGVAALTLQADGSSDDGASLLSQHVRRTLEARAANVPVILAIEDIHWADPSSMELLDVALSSPHFERLLIICTTRKSTPTDWLSTRPKMRISLGGLDEPALAELIKASTLGRLSPTLIKGVVGRAAGVPLFAEELSQHLVEQGGSASLQAIPNSLSGLLSARLSELGEEMAIAQVAAVVGAEFDGHLLLELARVPRERLAAGLGRLIDLGVLCPTPLDGSTYKFRHALLRDAAYDTLLKAHRRALHGSVAEILAGSPHHAPPEVLARHWIEAGCTAKAVDALRAAGAAARTRKAFREAQAAFERALKLLSDLPVSPERDRNELEVQSALAGVLQITLGYSSPKAAEAANRARRLAEREGALEHQLAHTAGQWMAASSAGDYASAIAVARRILPLALTHGGPNALGLAWMIELTTRYRIGDLQGSEQAYQSGGPSFRHRDFARRPGAVAQTFGNAAINALLLGNVGEARRRAACALSMTRASRNQYDAAFAAYMVGMFEVILGADAAAERLARRALMLSDEHSFPQFAATSRVVLGRALAGLGRADEGAPLIQEGMRAMSGTHSRVGLSMYQTWLGEALMFQGDAHGARAAFVDALDVNPQELFYRPETLRLLANVLRQVGEAEQASRVLSDAKGLATSMESLWHMRRLGLKPG